MALDPRIGLLGQAPNVAQTFSNLLSNISQADSIRQQQQLAPLQQRQAEISLESQEQALINQRDQARLASLAQGASQILPDLQAGNVEGVRKTLQARKQRLISNGLPTEETDEAITQLEQDPQRLLETSQQVVQLNQQFGTQTARQPTAQFGGQQTVKDEAGNLFFATTRRNPSTGTVESVLAPLSGGDAQPQGQVQLVTSAGQTPEERQATTVATAGKAEAAKLQAQLERAPTVEGAKAASKQAIKKSGEAFNRLEKIDVSLNNFDEVDRLIDEGASTGVISSRLPSLRQASVQLDNLQGRLGLDVIGNTTFGALSEAELKFALDTALPKKLPPEELKRWVARKRDTTQRLRGYIQDVATFLGTPGNTVADFIELQKVEELEKEQAPTPQVIRFDAQGNIIQ